MSTIKGQINLSITRLDGTTWTLVEEFVREAGDNPIYYLQDVRREVLGVSEMVFDQVKGRFGSRNEAP